MAAGLTTGLDWETLAGESAGAVDAVHAVLVTGTDPVAAARAALGIGRVQSRGRRVAIGDLVGDVEPLQRLVTGDDPHGIVDSFMYGVSLNKIARQVDDAGMLFVMPSGTEPNVTADIIRNERWRRLAAGFREVGALLLLVAPSDAEGVRELAMMVDGVVVVGDAAAVLAVPRHSVLLHIEAPAAATDDAATLERKPAAAGAAAAPVMLPPHVTDEQRPITPYPADGKALQTKMLIAAGVVLALIAGWFIAGRPGLSVSSSGARGGVSPEVAAVADSVAAQLSPETTGPPAPETPAFARVENPQDSAAAAPFGVVIVATNDEAQALARWADLGLKLPAGTVTMVRVRGERGRFFQMQAGAFTRAKQADSLLSALRASGKLPADAGRVITTPYALMLEKGVSRAAAQNVANGYGQRQIAAYALLQADGTATIFVGAFESPDQAVPLMSEMLAKGVNSTLYYRTGRSF
jgi:SPOR domain